MLTEVKEPPKDGTQFIMTWFFNGQPWCDTYRYNNGVLEYYLESDNEGNCVDAFVPADRAWTRSDIQYFVNSDKTFHQKIEGIVDLSEDWCKDQSNGLTDGEVCIGALKDIRRLVKS